MSWLVVSLICYVIQSSAVVIWFVVFIRYFVHNCLQTFPTVEDTYEAWIEVDRAQRERIRIYDTAGLVRINLLFGITCQIKVLVLRRGGDGNFRRSNSKGAGIRGSGVELN